MSKYDARYAKQWRVDRARGIDRTVPARDVAMHVATLVGAGWSLRAIAGEAEVSPQTITRLNRGATKRMTKETAERILRVQPDTVPIKPSMQTTEPFVPRVGAVRRIQALLFMGWPLSHLLEHYGINNAVAYQQGRWVTRSTHDRIVQAYDDLAGRRGPSPRSAARARRAGYVGPLDWDDIDHDEAPVTRLVPDEDEFVDEVAVQRRVDGDATVPLNRAERLEAVRRLHAQGFQDTAIARRAGMDQRQILRDRQTLGLPANADPNAHPVSTEHFSGRRRKAIAS